MTVHDSLPNLFPSRFLCPAQPEPSLGHLPTPNHSQKIASSSPVLFPGFYALPRILALDLTIQILTGEILAISLIITV